MKKIYPIGVCVIALCSLLLVGVVKAGNPAYGVVEMPSAAACTVDGKWTTATEWTDAPYNDMSGNGTGKFGYLIQDFTGLGLEWIVEFTSDNTNDAGDKWIICLENDNTGGTAPQTDMYKIEITGHTTLKLYQGTGSAWTEVAPGAGELTWQNTIDTSRWSSTPHWILEIVDSSKTSGTIQTGQPPNGMMVAAFDASTNQYAAWAPNARANVPNEWGVISDYSMENTAPEGIGFGVILLASSIAVMTGFYYSRKRPKTTDSNP